MVSAGGQDVGILQLNGQSTAPLYTSGQRMASDTNSPWPLSNAVRNPAGDLYFTHSGGLYRNVAGKVEALQRTQTNVASTTKTLSFYKLQWFQGSYNATISGRECAAAPPLHRAIRSGAGSRKGGQQERRSHRARRKRAHAESGLWIFQRLYLGRCRGDRRFAADVWRHRLQRRQGLPS